MEQPELHKEGKEFEELLQLSGEKSLPGILSEMPAMQLMDAFRKMKIEPQKIQELVLLDIIKHAENSEIGLERKFREIKTARDYQKRLPITEYADYEEAARRMARGEGDLLFNGKTARFIATSGTTGIAKLIPESENGETVKALVSKMRMNCLLALSPDIMQPDRKVLSITNPSEYSKTEAGIPIGSASGQAVKDTPKEFLEKLILPSELILSKNVSNEAMDYLVLLLALAQRNMAAVVCSNIAHFDILLGKTKAYGEDLIQDIRNGTVSEKIPIDPALRKAITARLSPNPARAEELSTVLCCGDTDAARLWPYFSTISCWMAASSYRIVEDFKKKTPASVRFLEWGYGASEGKFNIPSRANDSSGDLALFGYFFEFLPVGCNEPLLAHELTAGGYYEIIVTSYSGLYRYNMKDIVFVTGMDGGSPRIVFAAKTGEHIWLGDEKIFIYEIEDIVKKACGVAGGDIRFYQVLPEEKEKRLVLIVEPSDNAFEAENFIRVFEELLRSSHTAYDWDRAHG